MGCPSCFYWGPVKEESVSLSLQGFKRRIGAVEELWLAFSRVSFLSFKLLLSGNLHQGENVMEKLTVVKFFSIFLTSSLAEICFHL